MQVVTTSPLIKTYSLDEFWSLPEPKDGSKYELIAGVLYMSPPPDFPHNYSSATLNQVFYSHIEQSGNKGLVFTPRAALWTSSATYVEPDLFYISEDTLNRINIRKPHTADLVVEIISPGTAIYDRNTKADTYAGLGVRELWLIDPLNLIIEVRHLLEGEARYDIGRVFKQGDLVESKVLPTFSPSVTRICNAVPHKTK
ncbi:MAG TPA: Uma2 family endonuclease [Blastocatellia bacterium]|nr:Uma2 family endonuclease [Blastocatellia bacterium]HMX26224.1 Uma2 family endonuclease [Blastocatellia bacterium]HMZ18875.1 Uma2 family endonuclease [Blastocatellia bacterium]HNG30230.1 Uma2 family endonuclease [Blastocatellia bacterium]